MTTATPTKIVKPEVHYELRKGDLIRARLLGRKSFALYVVDDPMIRAVAKTSPNYRYAKVHNAFSGRDGRGVCIAEIAYVEHDPDWNKR